MAIDAEPGFTKEAFYALSLKGKEKEPVLVNLVLDEMSIRQRIQ